MDTRCARSARLGTPAGRRRLRVGGLVAVLSLAVAAACGGDDGGGDADTTTTAVEPAPTATSTTTTVVPVAAARDFTGSSGVVIAHRGASGTAPEHTEAAFDQALADGADYLELDLQLTADGVAVVLHDATLDRTVRGPAPQCSGPVGERTVADLEACEAGAWFNEANPEQADEGFVGQPIPTLDRVLERYGAGARYYIEIKSPEEQPGLEEALLATLDATELDPGDGTLPPVVIQSFSGDSLRRIHEQRPELPLVQLVAPGVVLDGEALDRVADYAVAVAPNKADVDADWVAAANARCLDVHPWTVNGVEDMERLLAAGVGAQFTNHPDRLVEVVAAQPERSELCRPPAVDGS